MNVVGEGKKAGKQWAGLAVLMLPLLITSTTVTVLFFALPAITADLRLSGVEQLWIVDIYTFALAGLLLPMGNLGDRIGQRRLLLAGSAVLGITSAGAAFAPSAEFLIVARGLQGLAAASLMPGTLALIRVMFTDTRKRQMAIALWAATLSVGSVVGPIVGGWMLERFWWGSIFLINVPLVALVLVVGPFLIPESPDLDASKSFDIASGTLFLLAALPLVYAIKQLSSGGDLRACVAGAAVGSVFLTLFLRRQRRLAAPMVDLSLFRNVGFSLSLTSAAVAMFSLVGTTLFLTQYLMLVLDLRPVVAGLATSPAAVTSILGATLAARIARQVRPGFIIGQGMLSMAVGFLQVVRLDTQPDPVTLVAATALLGWGIGSASAVTSDMVVALAPRSKAGAVSGTFQFSTEFGAALGAAVLGSIGLAVYRSSLLGSDLTGMPEVPSAAVRETLGGALATAEKLSGESGEILRAAARAAYVDGMHIAAVSSMAISVLAGVLVIIGLRRKKADYGAR
ncbi:MFS transporter [Nonomuraea sp. NPDC001699]